MKVLKTQRTLCLCCMEEHDVQTVCERESMLFKGEEVEYDAVLMDVQMPVMDGYTATGIIREKTVGLKKHLPIIAMTANAFDADRQESLKAGMDDYIPKPVDYKLMRRILAKYLTKK